MFTSVFPETPKILVHLVMLCELVFSESPRNAFPSSRDELSNTGKGKRKAFYPALTMHVLLGEGPSVLQSLKKIFMLSSNFSN